LQINQIHSWDSAVFYYSGLVVFNPASVGYPPPTAAERGGLPSIFD
jgi:hypothetical protein